MSQKFQSGISTPRGFPELLVVFSLRWKTEKVEVGSNMGQRMAQQERGQAGQKQSGFLPCLLILAATRRCSPYLNRVFLFKDSDKKKIPQRSAQKLVIQLISGAVKLPTKISYLMWEYRHFMKCDDRMETQF